MSQLTLELTVNLGINDNASPVSLRSERIFPVTLVDQETVSVTGTFTKPSRPSMMASPWFSH